MSETAQMDQAVRELAHEALAEHSQALGTAGLRATLEVQRWGDPEAANSEIRLAFWRGDAFVDVLEDFIVREGRPAASLDEFKQWLDDGIRTILIEASEP